MSDFEYELIEYEYEEDNSEYEIIEYEYEIVEYDDDTPVLPSATSLPTAPLPAPLPPTLAAPPSAPMPALPPLPPVRRNHHEVAASAYFSQSLSLSTTNSSVPRRTSVSALPPSPASPPAPSLIPSPTPASEPSSVREIHTPTPVTPTFIISSRAGGSVDEYRRVRITTMLPTCGTPLEAVAVMVTNPASTRGMSTCVLLRGGTDEFNLKFEGDAGEMDALPPILRQGFLCAKPVQASGEKKRIAIYVGNLEKHLPDPIAFVHIHLRNTGASLLATDGDAPVEFDAKKPISSAVSYRRELLSSCLAKPRSLSALPPSLHVVMPALTSTGTLGVHRPGHTKQSMAKESCRLAKARNRDGEVEIEPNVELTQFADKSGRVCACVRAVSISPQQTSEGSVLPYYGRSTLPSRKNFQIRTETKNPELLLLLGKRSSQEYSLDFRGPFTPIAAFGLAIMAFYN